MGVMASRRGRFRSPARESRISLARVVLLSACNLKDFLQCEESKTHNCVDFGDSERVEDDSKGFDEGLVARGQAQNVEELFGKVVESTALGLLLCQTALLDEGLHARDNRLALVLVLRPDHGNPVAQRLGHALNGGLRSERKWTNQKILKHAGFFEERDARILPAGAAVNNDFGGGGRRGEVRRRLKKE